MLDLGSSFVASVARDPEMTALVDGELRLTLLQNRWEAATLHWACQLAGLVITPINWRANADELDFCIENAEACAVVYQDVSAEAVKSATRANRIARIAVGTSEGDALTFTDMLGGASPDATPRVSAEAWSIMLYTSGTTSRPKGVPRRHRCRRGRAHGCMSSTGGCARGSRSCWPRRAASSVGWRWPG